MQYVQQQKKSSKNHRSRGSRRRSGAVVRDASCLGQTSVEKQKDELARSGSQNTCMLLISCTNLHVLPGFGLKTTQGLQDSFYKLFPYIRPTLWVSLGVRKPETIRDAKFSVLFNFEQKGNLVSPTPSDFVALKLALVVVGLK